MVVALSADCRHFQVVRIVILQMKAGMAAFQAHQPSIVINAAAYTTVMKRKSRFRGEWYGVRYLVEANTWEAH